jgi:integrase/recombinase XerD
LSKKYPPEDITQSQLEDFIIWLVDKKNVGSSYQKVMIATITKFYKEIFQKTINLKHLYPQISVKRLPNLFCKERILIYITII